MPFLLNDDENNNGKIIGKSLGLGNLDDLIDEVLKPDGEEEKKRFWNPKEVSLDDRDEE